MPPESQACSCDTLDVLLDSSIPARGLKRHAYAASTAVLTRQGLHHHLLLKAASRLPANERHLAELVIESAIEIAERRRLADRAGRAGRQHADRFARAALKEILADDGMVAMPLTAWFGVILPVAYKLADAREVDPLRRVGESGPYAATLDFLDVRSR